MAATIEFPALTLSRGRLLAASSADELETCGQAALDRGYFSDFELIDSRERLFRLRQVRKLRHAGPFWGYRLLRSRRIRIRLDFEDPVQLELPEVRRRVIASIRKEAGFWEAGWDIDELAQQVETSSGVPALAEMLFSRSSR